jgi:hypothetical protein
VYRSVDLLANVSFSRARFRSFTEYVVGNDGSFAVVRDGNPVAGFPNATANVGVDVQRAGWSARVSGQYLGKQYIDNSGGRSALGASDSGLVVDPSFLVNLSLRYAFEAGKTLSGFSIAVDVNNVTNTKALLFGNVGFGTPQFFPNATRHVFVSVKYLLD